MLGAYSVGITAVVVAVIIALNLLVSQLPSTVIRPDFTKEKLATVGADSEKVLKGVDSEITIYRVYSKSYTYTDQSNNQKTIPLDTNLKNLLEKYEDACSKIKVKEIDPVDNPKFLEEYTDKTLSQNGLVVVSEKRSIYVDSAQLYLYEIEGYEGQYLTYEEYYNYSMNAYYSGGSVGAVTEYFFAENEITRAIDYVNNDKLPIIYEMTGHGEGSIAAGAFGKLITAENVELKELVLLSGEGAKVPADASAVIIFAPSADITEAEKDALVSYLNGGGKIFFYSYHAYHNAEKMPNFTALCAHMGLEAIEGIIAESDESHYYPYPYYIIPEVSGKGITEAFASSSLYLFMNESHAVRSTGEGKNVTVLPLLETTDGGYIYTEETAKDPSKAEKSTFSLAYQSTLSDEEGGTKGTLYWFASPYFLTDSYVNYGNGQIFTELISKSCDKPASVSVAGKPLPRAYLQLNQSTSMIWSIAVVGIIPAIALISGFVVWIKRRSR